MSEMYISSVIVIALRAAIAVDPQVLTILMICKLFQ